MTVDKTEFDVDTNQMKNTILTTLLLATSVNSHAALIGPKNLSCKLQQMQQTDYTATLKGPSSKGTYKMEVQENYYGYIFKNSYTLNVQSMIELSSSKASIKEINIIDNKFLVEIKTDKVGPITLICQ